MHNGVISDTGISERHPLVMPQVTVQFHLDLSQKYKISLNVSPCCLLLHKNKPLHHKIMMNKKMILVLQIQMSSTASHIYYYKGPIMVFLILVT